MGTVTPVVAKADTTPLDDRLVIELWSNEGSFYYMYVGDSEVPVAADITTHGILLFRRQSKILEATAGQVVYLLSAAGTINVVVAERA